MEHHNPFIQFIDHLYSFSFSKIITPRVKLVALFVIGMIFIASIVYLSYYRNLGIGEPRADLNYPRTIKNYITFYYISLCAAIPTGIVLFGLLLLLLIKLSEFISRSNRKYIIDPIKQIAIRFKGFITQTNVWRTFINKPIRLVEEFEAKEILYPMLFRLEPGIEQTRYELFVLDKLPGSVLSYDLEYIESTLHRYENYIMTITGVAFFGSFLLFGIDFVLALLLSPLEGSIAFNGIITMQFLASFYVFIIVTAGIGRSTTIRKNMWIDLRETEIIKSRYGGEAIRSNNDVLVLTAALERMRQQVYVQNVRTEQAIIQREEELRHITTLDDLSEGQKISMIWWLKREKETTELEARRKLRRDRIWDVGIATIFFLLGIIVSPLK